MAKRLTHEEFLQKVYSKNKNIKVLSQYDGSQSLITRECLICGDIREVKARSLLEGYGCKNCQNINTGDRNRFTQEQFEEKVKSMYPNIKILSEYKNSRKKVRCLCLIDGSEWEAIPDSLFGTKYGCPECARKERNRRTPEEFREELKEKFPNIELLSDYTGINNVVKLKCKVCGYEWEGLPSTLLHRSTGGCWRCMGHAPIKEEEIQSRIDLLNPYVEYVGGFSNITSNAKFRCKKCGKEWETEANGVLNNGSGCPYCNMSKMEIKIKLYSETHNIKYIPQYRFKDCKDKYTLPFDFYFPDYNAVCEAMGRQHYESVDFFGGNEAFRIRQKHDKIKAQYCQDHNIKLIIIKHTDFDHIEEILDKEIA